MSKKFHFIKLINLDKQSGKGHAIKVGLEYIETTHLIVHDADLEYNPLDIPEMFDIAKLNPSTLVLGSRTIGHKNRNNKYQFIRFGNKIFSYFFSTINFFKISDISTCYWLVETEILKKLDLKENGFAIEVEVFSKFLRTKNNVIEVPISYEGRLFKEGKKLKLKDGVLIFLKIIKYSKLLNIFKLR